jgi:hypothetical protein
LTTRSALYTFMDSRYPFLKGTFFHGTLRGQITSVWNTRDDNPGKVADFKRAIADGKITLDVTQIGRVHLQKLMGLGVTGFHVPEKPSRVNKPRPKQPEPDLSGVEIDEPRGELPGVRKAPERRSSVAANQSKQAFADGEAFVQFAAAGVVTGEFACDASSALRSPCPSKDTFQGWTNSNGVDHVTQSDARMQPPRSYRLINSGTFI